MEAELWSYGGAGNADVEQVFGDLTLRTNAP